MCNGLTQNTLKDFGAIKDNRNILSIKKRSNWRKHGNVRNIGENWVVARKREG